MWRIHIGPWCARRVCELYNAYSRTFIVVHLGVSYHTIEPCCNCTIKLNVICTKHVCCTAACTLNASVVHFENAAYANGFRVSTLVFKYRRCGRLGGWSHLVDIMWVKSLCLTNLNCRSCGRFAKAPVLCNLNAFNYDRWLLAILHTVCQLIN